VKYVENLFNESSDKLNWSGGNTEDARSDAAEDFAEQIYEWYLEHPDEPIRLVGHSHGGNVAIMLTNLLAEKGVEVETLITIATPVREYKLNAEVGQFIHMYNNRDAVQTSGVQWWKLTLGIEGTRKMKGAENVRAKDAEKKGTKVQAHSAMHSNINIWMKYIEPILKKN
jgi:thioesterase domain-containing protein